MPEIKFIGPPPTSKKNVQNEIADALKARPGEWAVVRIADSVSKGTSASNYIRAAKSSVYHPAGSFESVYRCVDGEHRVYARYVGTEAGDSDA